MLSEHSSGERFAFPDSERRQERRFNRKGVVMNIHRVFESKKTKGHKQRNSQYRLRSPMVEGGIPWF